MSYDASILRTSDCHQLKPLNLIVYLFDACRIQIPRSSGQMSDRECSLFTLFHNYKRVQGVRREYIVQLNWCKIKLVIIFRVLSWKNKQCPKETKKSKTNEEIFYFYIKDMFKINIFFTCESCVWKINEVVNVMWKYWHWVINLLRSLQICLWQRIIINKRWIL